MSVQCFAEASQKFTCPGDTSDNPALTVAVRVTAAPETTVVTGPLPEVTAIVVVVAVFVCADAFPQALKISKARRMQTAAMLRSIFVWLED